MERSDEARWLEGIEDMHDPRHPANRDRPELTCECGMSLGPDNRCADCDDAWYHDNHESAEADDAWAGAFDGLPTFQVGRY